MWTVRRTTKDGSSSGVSSEMPLPSGVGAVMAPCKKRVIETQPEPAYNEQPALCHCVWIVPYECVDCAQDDEGRQ